MLGDNIVGNKLKLYSLKVIRLYLELEKKRKKRKKKFFFNI